MSIIVESISYKLFKWRYELPMIKKVVLCLLMAGLTGLAAQIKVYLPFTPVPITGQVFAVLLSGTFLGRYYGALSQGFYILLGAAGIPWFANFSSGTKVIFGVTGGYIWGFVFASTFVGWFSERFIVTRKFLPQVIIMLLGVMIIYFCGAVQFVYIMKTTFMETLTKAVLPFIPLDILKSILVATISTTLLPKKSYDNELDR